MISQGHSFGLNCEFMNRLTYLIVFKLLDSFVFLAFTFCLNCVGPLGNAGLTNLVQLLALVKPHGLIVLFLVGLRAHTFDALKLIDSEHSRVLGGQCLCLLFGVGHASSLLEASGAGVSKA